jgi:hypothetical protein
LTRVHIVLCLWKGWRPVYDWRDVRTTVRLLRAAGFNTPADRIICASNEPQTVWVDPECAVVPLWPEPTGEETTGRPTCFRRLRLFDPVLQSQLDIEPGDIVMSVDLDTLPLPGMRRLVRQLEVSDFCAMAGLAARLHGALWGFRAGSHTGLWTQFDPRRSPLTMHLEGYQRGLRRQVGSDQAWLSYKLPLDVPRWTQEHGAYSWNLHHGLSPGWTVNACFWSFAGHIKPRAELVQQVRPDLHSAYMAAYGED